MFNTTLKEQIRDMDVNDQIPAQCFSHQTSKQTALVTSEVMLAGHKQIQSDEAITQSHLKLFISGISVLFTLN